MENSKPLVIVLSRNYSTGLGVIRSLGVAGYTVDLIASTKKKGSSVIASCSKYVRNAVEVVTPKIQGDTGAGLIAELMKYVGKSEEKMVLFPVDDFTTSVVDANRRQLEKHFFMPGIRGDKEVSISGIMDKTVQGERAKSAGLLTPEEWLINLKGEIEIPKDISYPCFVKPLQSVSGHKNEMTVCRNERELESHLLSMKSFYSNRSVLVQEYLNIDKEFDLSGVCTEQQVIIPAVIEKTRIAKHELGVTLSGKLLSPDVLGTVKDKIVELMRQTHYIGMFDMELNLCGDKIYFNEINFRSGGPNYSYFLNGVNLPDIFVKEITGKGHDLEEEKLKCFGKTFVYEKVAWEDYINSYMTKHELMQCIRAADYTLLEDKNDPEPGNHFRKRIRLSAMKHKMKKMLKRKENRSVEKKNPPRVVVTGRNYCNILTMTRALGEAGYEVDILRVYKKRPARFNLLGNMEPDKKSKYVRNFKRCIVNGHQKIVVDELLGMAEKKEKCLLVPVDDYLACIVDESLKQLSEYYIVPNIRNMEGEISRLMDKNEQKKMAALYELPMLHSVLIKCENGQFEIPENVHYPCFIKPNVSMNSTKSKMTKCNDRKELETVLSKYAQKEDFEMLVEEYAEIKAEYSLLGLSTQKKTIAPCIFKVIEGGHKERKGVTIVGESVSDTQFRTIIDRCVEYVNALQYTGLFDIDLLETIDGRIYFIELNFRAGASTHLFTKTGVNLPGILADNLLEDKRIDNLMIEQISGKRFVSEKVLLEEYVRSDADIHKVKRLMNNADVYFIKDEQDVKPYNYFKKYYLIAALLRIPYRIRDRKLRK